MRPIASAVKSSGCGDGVRPKLPSPVSRRRDDGVLTMAYVECANEALGSLRAPSPGGVLVPSTVLTPAVGAGQSHRASDRRGSSHPRQ
jgi:hypothetical protein